MIKVDYVKTKLIVSSFAKDAEKQINEFLRLKEVTYNTLIDIKTMGANTYMILYLPRIEQKGGLMIGDEDIPKEKK